MSFWNLKKSKALKPTHSIWKTGLSARKPFKDSDKDKVIDIFDCQPHNRKKQGEMHEFETIDESRRKKYPGMKKQWTNEEEKDFKERKEKLRKVVEDKMKQASDNYYRGETNY